MINESGEKNMSDGRVDQAEEQIFCRMPDMKILGAVLKQRNEAFKTIESAERQYPDESFHAE